MYRRPQKAETGAEAAAQALFHAVSDGLGVVKAAGTQKSFAVLLAPLASGFIGQDLPP